MTLSIWCLYSFNCHDLHHNHELYHALLKVIHFQMLQQIHQMVFFL